MYLNERAESAANTSGYQRRRGDKVQPHQQRVVDEKKELDSKLEKLERFLDGSVFQALPDAEQSRLMRQSVIMKDYSSVLGERIAAFSV